MAGPRPAIPGPVETAVLFWRWLRRMRTALYLLGVLGLAVLLATVVPQRPNVPETADAWLEGTEGPGRSVAAVADALGLFDVFASPWFVVLLALLFTSLTACLIPRIRAYARTVRRGRPPLLRSWGSRPERVTFDVDASADTVVAAAGDVLRRRRYRVRTDRDATVVSPTRSDPTGVVVAAPADDDTTTWGGAAPAGARPGWVASPRQVAAERGHLAREGGSLVFHVSFYLLLIGVVIGELTSFVGQVGVVEDEPGFTDTPVAYWTADPGRWWRATDHSGFNLRLDDFDVAWTDNGVPVEFTSEVTLTPSDGGAVRHETTVVNDPLVIQGMKIHQLDWGWAPRVVVEQDGEVLHDAFITVTATDQPGVWRGVVKVPAARPQLGFELFLFPSAPEDEQGRLVPTGRPQPDDPAVLFLAWRGDLRLDRVQGVNTLDTARMTEFARGGLRPEGAVDIADGVTVRFPELRHWVGFQVSRRPTVPLLLAAAVLLLVGLLPALYAYRRRVWVRAEELGSGRTRVTVAGHAYQRPQIFEDELERLVRELRTGLGGTSDEHEPAEREVVRP